jgi:2-keto-4-pentenoate hydratase/2-oxohepta-3-ene-1,7-dioic acid hydratase in catechol pathway
MKLIATDQGFGRLDGEVFTALWSTAASYFAGVEPHEAPPRPLHEVTLAALSPSPSKVVCVGLNYRDHAEEARQPIPQVPVLFPKFANSIAGPGPVTIPRAVQSCDYEAELAVVIGRRASRVTTDDALAHVAGYCCANDLSARDLQFETAQWLRGKAVDGFLPLGPWLVTPDEVPDPQALEITCHVNGEQRQRSSTKHMIFGVAELISFISQTCTLEPGDVIITGTPFGVGMGFDPPRYLSPGDEVTVTISGLGSLVTTFISE